MALGTAVAAVRAAIAALNDFDAAAGDEATELLRDATAAAQRCSQGSAADVLELVSEALVWPEAVSGLRITNSNAHRFLDYKQSPGWTCEHTHSLPCWESCSLHSHCTS